jgi:uncharacterized Zn ribbon protein
MDCPDCRSALSYELLYKLRCVGCGAKFWFRGGEVIREGEYAAVSTSGPPITLVTPPAPPEPAPSVVTVATDSAQGMRAHVFCPACRAELVHEHLSELVCSGCGERYWQRGGEVVPAGETEAVETPGTELPGARARFRKPED